MCAATCGNATVNAWNPLAVPPRNNAAPRYVFLQCSITTVLPCHTTGAPIRHIRSSPGRKKVKKSIHYL
jgi:hypothetical protein